MHNHEMIHVVCVCVKPAGCHAGKNSGSPTKMLLQVTDVYSGRRFHIIIYLQKSDMITL